MHSFFFMLLKKWEELLHCKSFSQFFNKNIGIFQIKRLKRFEQPAPGFPAENWLF